jgi:UDP:flavonoid glycosyltransferase YjiC (YdhE family)
VRILFTNVAMSGHLFPLVPLAWACRTLGHDVLVATSENFVPAVLRAGLPAVACGPAAGVIDLRAAGVVDPTADGPLTSEEEQRYAHGRAFGRIARRNLPGISALVESWRPQLIVSERAEFAGPVAAAAAGIPHVELHWGIAPLTEYGPAAVAELATEPLAAGLDGLPTPAMVLNPWPPSLRLTHTLEHHNMRYVPYNGDAHVPHWALEPRDRPRICLTLGTVLPHLGADGVTKIVLPVLDRLARLDVELVVAVDDEVAAGWPALPDAVRHAGRMPLSHVLKACDIAINHGGQGTALTALEAGTPQLVLPQFDDQFDNADAVVKAGAGLALLPQEISPSSVTQCCLEILDLERYRETAADVAAEIAAQPSASDVVEILETLGSGS